MRPSSSTILLAKAERLVADGADMLDVGGVKAGPGPEVTEAEELDRVVEPIAVLHASFDVPLSVDTWRASVARESYRAGAVMGNDISGFADPDYLEGAAADAGASVVATHIRLAPRVRDPEPGIRRRGRDGVRVPRQPGPNRRCDAGIPAERIVVDAGFDLGKTPAQSLELLRGTGPAERARLPGARIRLQQDVPRRGSRSRHRPPARGIRSPRPRSGSRSARRVVRVHDVAGTRRVRDAMAAIFEADLTVAATSRASHRPGARGALAGAILVRGDDPSLVAQAVRDVVAELVGGPGRRDGRGGAHRADL